MIYAKRQRTGVARTILALSFVDIDPTYGPAVGSKRILPSYRHGVASLRAAIRAELELDRTCRRLRRNDADGPRWEFKSLVAFV
jgi:hypothetical protein